MNFVQVPRSTPRSRAELPETVSRKQEPVRRQRKWTKRKSARSRTPWLKKSKCKIGCQSSFGSGRFIPEIGSRTKELKNLQSELQQLAAGNLLSRIGLTYHMSTELPACHLSGICCLRQLLRNCSVAHKSGKSSLVTAPSLAILERQVCKLNLNVQK